MTLRTLLFAIFAIVLAGGAAWTARNWIDTQRAALQSQINKAPEPEPASVFVMVARQSLPRGAFFRPQVVRWQAWPDDAVPDSYILQGNVAPEDLVGAVLRETVDAGQPVTRGRLVFPGDTGFLAAVLKPGYRAVTIGVSDVSGVAGFVFPGDQVDIILAQAIKISKEVTRRATVTALEDVRVLAIDQAIDDRAGAAATGKTVTLEVDPKTAEAVTLLPDMGRLSLSLRSLAPDPSASAGAMPDLAAPAPAEETYQLAADRKAAAPVLNPWDLKSHTWDVEVSPLLIRPASKKSQTRSVTVMRGGNAEVQQFGGAGQ
ncbi:MAG: Flp pilus assembly protein CpaB [Rhodospirillales bacterium]